MSSWRNLDPNVCLSVCRCQCAGVSVGVVCCTSRMQAALLILTYKRHCFLVRKIPMHRVAGWLSLPTCLLAAVLSHFR